MTTPFLCGMLVAWAIAQVLLGMFFALAYAVRRREVEYLLFGLLCFAIAVTTSGAAWGHNIATPEEFLSTSAVAHAGAIAASALNLHFVMRYAELKAAPRVALTLYASVTFFELMNAFGLWWQEGTLSTSHATLLDIRITHMAAQPSPFAVAFYAVAAIELVISIVLLFNVYRSGKREALVSLIGGLIVSLAVINDVLLISGVLSRTMYLVPHAFLAYAFSVAATLLVRYRAAAGQLEQTTWSLREATEELRQSHDELREIQDELSTKQQLATVGELAAAIAHEVRNPLAVIVNAIAGLRRGGMGDDDRKMLLDIVDEEAARLNRLVTDLLRFARPVTVRRSAVSLVELAHRAESLAREGQTVQVSIADDPEVKTVWVDPGLFRLVFDNLVENACQSMPGGGTVSIEITRAALDERAFVRVDIKDVGQGMEPEVLERATDPFFTTRPSGTGLGLPIVQRIIEAHGGEIEIDSEPGAGTCVSLLIPMGEPELSDRPASSRSPSALSA